VNARLILASVLFGLTLAAGSLLVAEGRANDRAGDRTEGRAESRTVPSASQPTPVTRQEVWQAIVADLHERGFSEAQLPPIEGLDLPVALPAVAGRKLRVASACWDEGSARTQFRLECAEPGQCLPFLAYVQVRVGGESTRAGSCRTKSELHAVAEASLKSLAKPTVHPGDRATAVFLSARLRISANVTCLERGREGEVIRVRGEDGQVFRARISGPTLLEAVPQ
jgi:hypothetical protein